MSLSGINLSGSVNHWSRELASHITLADFTASEYLKLVMLPAFLPKTPRSRGPSFSRSRAWHPAQRFAKTSRPWFGSPASFWPAETLEDGNQFTAQLQEIMIVTMAITAI